MFPPSTIPLSHDEEELDDTDADADDDDELEDDMEIEAEPELTSLNSFKSLLTCVSDISLCFKNISSFDSGRF